LTLEPFQIRIIASAHGGPGLPLKQLSESERFRFNIAFQLALATATGIRFVAIDGADILDKEWRKLLTALLLRSDIDQTIVLATGEDPPPITIPAGVKFFDLTRPVETSNEHGAELPSKQNVAGSSPAGRAIPADPIQSK